MDFCLAFVAGMTSIGYMAQSTKKYLNFKKFEATGYIDDYHLVDGKITSTTNMNSIVHEYEGKNVDNVIMKNLNVSVGKDKIGTGFQPMQVGKNTIMVPYSYQYTNWKTTHNKNHYLDNYTLNNKIKLSITNFVSFFRNNYTISIHNIQKMMGLYKIFDKYNIGYGDGNKVEVIEKCIHNEEEISVFGKYITNKEIDVKYLGDKTQIMSAVRKNVCNLKYDRNCLAGCVLIGSIMYIACNYDNAKGTNEYKRNKNNY